MTHTYGGPTGDSFADTGAGLVYRDSAAATDGTSGLNSGGGKLWMPIWSGEVIHAYDQYNKFEGMVDSRTISSGTTMEFPITGTVSLKPAWGAGEELIGGEDAAATTFQVKLDKRPMAAHFELDNVDLMITQWEYRAELARQAGMTLANARDKQIASFIAQAAVATKLAADPRAVSPRDPFWNVKYEHLGDNLHTDENSTDPERTDAALQVLQDIEIWMVYLQESDIPTEGVYCAVTAAAFADIRALGVARIAADLGGSTVSASEPLFAGIAERGGLGSSLAGRPFVEETLEYMGCTICKSNHTGIRSTYVAAADQIGEGRYNGNFLGNLAVADKAGVLTGLLWQRGCIASLALQGMKVDNVDDIRRNTSFTVASMMKGTGILRPECACALVDTYKTGDGTAPDTRVKQLAAWDLSASYVQQT
jgi:hypothetical protein